MKKMIAAISSVCAIGFAVALANTNDNGASDTSETATTSSISQEAGAAADNAHDTMNSETSKMNNSMDAQKNAMNNEVDTTKKKTETHWRTAKSCTDENGVTYYRGKDGFKTCVDKMKKSNKEMGGTAPSDSTDTTNSDMNQ